MYCLNLAKLKLPFPELPSLGGSQLGLATEEINEREIWKVILKQQLLPCEVQCRMSGAVQLRYVFVALLAHPATMGPDS